MSVRISALYPNSEGGRFDFDYFAEHHLALVFGLLNGHGLRRIEADRGLAGADGQPAQYVAVGHMEFDSLEGFNTGFAAHGKEILADVPKYTDATPVVQVSEIATALP
jgi:uncharacterized protein (TIGR02118 family)